MKKKIFLVSALVAMAMSAMFVSCKKDSKNEPSGGDINGCKCTIYWEDGETDTEKISIDDMKEYYDVTSCSKLVRVLMSDAEGVDDIKCSEY